MAVKAAHASPCSAGSCSSAFATANAMEGTKHYRIMVAVETDASRYYGANASRPGLLGISDSEQLLAHLAADLRSLIPGISRCSLIASGALFDQTQLLRPAYPIFKALESASLAERTEKFQPGLVSIGSENGKMPLEDLQPQEDIPLGLLQLIPLVVHGPDTEVQELGQSMEYRFLEEGQLSAHSVNWMETAFGVSINHARFMTLTDLNALLHLQLDHFGFLPLWELLDAALNKRKEPLEVESKSGISYSWHEGAVHAEFETFDHWAGSGSGSELASLDQVLADGYGDWTREIRQYLTTLNAHGVEMVFHRGDNSEPLDGNFFVEQSTLIPDRKATTVTEHSFRELGTIAVSLVIEGKLQNYYPLSPTGLNDIHGAIRERVPGGNTVAFPGTILHDTPTRCLKADSDSEKGFH